MDVLDNAIENWENILAQATDIDPFARRYPLPQLEMRHCPLCDEHEDCVGCPVANRVGADQLRGDAVLCRGGVRPTVQCGVPAARSEPRAVAGAEVDDGLGDHQGG